MPAYWVARSKVNDPVEYKKYTDLVPAIIARVRRQGARARRFAIRSWKGRRKFHRFVVIEFPDLRAGRRLLHLCPNTTRAAAFRRGNGAGEVKTIMVEGGDPTR